MNDYQTVKIPLSRIKIILVLFLAVVFTWAGIWIFLYQPNLRIPILNNPIGKYAFAIALILHPTFIFFPLIKKLLYFRPGITIDYTGITDNSGTTSVRFIPWRDIEKITVADTSLSQKIIVVSILYPGDYIEKELNYFRKEELKSKMYLYGSPITIYPDRIQCKIKNLFVTLNEKRAEYYQMHREKLKNLNIGNLVFAEQEQASIFTDSAAVLCYQITPNLVADSPESDMDFEENCITAFDKIFSSYKVIGVDWTLEEPSVMEYTDYSDLYQDILAGLHGYRTIQFVFESLSLVIDINYYEMVRVFVYIEQSGLQEFLHHFKRAGFDVDRLSN